MPSRDYNKKINCEVVKSMSAKELSECGEYYLDQNFTGWCIFENKELEEYIFHVTNWNKAPGWGNKSFNYNHYYYDNTFNESEFVFNNIIECCDIKKIKIIIEKKGSRRFTTEDPFGEEDWAEEKMKTNIITEFKIFEEYGPTVIDYLGNEDIYGGFNNIKWYKKGKFVKEGIKWYSKGKLTLDPNSDINVTEYNDFITDNEFRQFLIDNGGYDDFINHCHKSCKLDFKNYFSKNKYGFIDSSLSWSDTDMGSDFWSDMDTKWNRIARGK